MKQLLGPLRIPAFVLLVAATLPSGARAQQELADLTPTGAAALDRAGFSVGLRGARAVLGAPYSDDKGPEAGAIHVFKGGSGTWNHAAELTAIDGTAGDELGFSVATDGSRFVAGAPSAAVAGHTDSGRVYVFHEIIGGYAQVKVEPNDPQASAAFGWSVAFNGTRLVVGAPFAGAGGAVYVFELELSGWTQTAKISSPGDPFGAFGWSVALDGERILVGAPRSDPMGVVNAGEAFAFIDTPLAWLPLGEFTAPVLEADANFGYAVALAGGDCFVGSPLTNTGGASNAGAVDVFSHIGPLLSLVHEKRLTLPGVAVGEELGWSLAAADGWVVAGAPGYGDESDGGAAFVFSREEDGWVQRCVLQSSATTHVLGGAIALDGKTALVGDQLHDQPLPDIGGAFVFDINTVETFGCTALNPPGSLTEFAGAPVIGEKWKVAMHNPLGTQLPGSMAFLAVSAHQIAAYPCGAILAGWGMGGAGASGELLLATTPEPVQLPSHGWNGTNPIPIVIKLPNVPAFVGQSIFVQGVMLGSAGSEVEIGLTEALRATLGVAVP